MVKTKILKVGLTILCSIILAYSISFISDRVNVLEKFTVALNDLDFTDLFYKNRTDSKQDNNIVVVNIGYLGRAELAGLLNTISRNKPKVIAGDVIFGEAGDSSNIEGTELLVDALKTIKKCVLVNSYQGKTEDGIDQIEGQSSKIAKYVMQGLANFNIAEDDREYGTVRSFEPITDINGNKQIRFFSCVTMG